MQFVALIMANPLIGVDVVAFYSKMNMIGDTTVSIVTTQLVSH
jgi:hypothetical protein